MAQILVSANRLTSMLENRHKEPEDLVPELKLKGDFLEMVTGDTVVEFDDIKKIAKYFKKPWSYLLIDEKEVFPNVGQDNRTVRNKTVPVSAEMVQTLQTAELRLATSIELFPEDKVKKPNLTLTTSVDPDDVSKSIRSFLNITLDEQLETKDEYAALRLWTQAVQESGIYVSQTRLYDKTIRAFSITKNSHAIIVVDTGDTPYARIFSLVHEYCHILLRNTGLCDLDDNSQTERYCNDFAAKVLLPKSLVVQATKDFSIGTDNNANEETIKKLSNKLGVSQAALLIRLHALLMISDGQYSVLETRRRKRKGGSHGSGGNYYAAAINAAGRKFATNVFGALSEKKINRSDASVLLGVGEHTVDRFKHELFSSSGGKQ